MFDVDCAKRTGSSGEADLPFPPKFDLRPVSPPRIFLIQPPPRKLKTLYIIFIAASAVFLVLSPIGLLIGISIHDLQSEVQKRQAELQTIEEKIEQQKQALQTVAEKKESQEKAIFVLRKDLRGQEEALQAQQIQIDKGNAINQQLWPNLLRDMAASAVTNERMKSLLISHGYK